METRTRLRIVLLLSLIVAVLPVIAYAGVPDVSDVMVTDVTTRSFSVIWAASEASTADLDVYEDENGTVPVAGAVITPHPVESGDSHIKDLAEDNGVMMVRVTGLLSNTTYYFRTITTSKSTADNTHYPESGPYMPVTTELSTTRTSDSGADVLPFSNDVIIQASYLDDGVTPAEGTLLVATVEGGNYPITAFVGDGVGLPYALIDLNNIFSRDSYENLDLSGGKNLTLLNFRGLSGNSIVTHEVPEDRSLSQVKPGDFGLKVGWNMFSFQLEPGVTDTETVLDPIMEEVSAVWGYDAENDKWLRYDKSGPPFLNDLNDLHCFTGYWVVMDDEASLMANGTFSTDAIQLHAGWNLVGSRSIETVELLDAVDSILDELNAVWTYETTEDTWLRYDKDGPPFLNDLEYIKPGKGYWLDMSEDAEW